MTSDNERALKALSRFEQMHDDLIIFSKVQIKSDEYQECIESIRTALQRDDSVVKEMATALEPFAAAFNKAEQVIVKDANNDLCHIIRATTFWLSYNDFLRAVSATSKFNASRGKK